jgi:hypothetical protein
MASSNKYARKVFNSPTYAEPCLVASAKQVLLKENWCVHLPSIDPPALYSVLMLLLWTNTGSSSTERSTPTTDEDSTACSPDAPLGEPSPPTSDALRRHRLTHVVVLVFRIYLPIMEKVYKSYFNEWKSDPSPPKEYVDPRTISS